MTGPQQRLYAGMVRLFETFGASSTTWRRTRSTGAAPGTSPTITQVSGIAIRFCPNNRVSEQTTLPRIPIYDAPYWGLATIAIDVQAGDIFDSGTLAFSITGAPDTSQGFLIAPAARTEPPA